MKKHLFFTILLAYFFCITYSATAQDIRLFTQNGQITASKYRINSSSTLTVFDANNKSKDINAIEVDSFFIENSKYVPVPRQQDIKTQTVFAKVLIEGYFSLLGTAKNTNTDLIFWEKDSTALFLSNEQDFQTFRAKVFLTQKLELIQLMRALKFGESNTSYLSKIINQMNDFYYPKEKIKHD